MLSKTCRSRTDTGKAASGWLRANLGMEIDGEQSAAISALMLEGMKYV
jgi:hypothetical protein